MGISPPLAVTDLSGNILIQILPPFLIYLVKTFLADSICLEDTQQASKLFKPYSPKLTLTIWLALPPRRRLCIFLHFVFFGINIFYLQIYESFANLRILNKTIYKVS